VKAKAVITKLDGRLVSAYFLDGRCIRINAPDPDLPTGNIYVGRVERVIPQLGGCFIEFQKGARGYYSLSDNRRAFWPDYPASENHLPKGGDRVAIQVKRPAIAPKEALLTSALSLTGYFLVLTAGVRSVHFSKKMKSREQDPVLKAALLEMTLPDDNKAGLPCGFIVRTNAAGACADDILAEAKCLRDRMEEIFARATTAPACTQIGEGQKEWEREIEQLPKESEPELVTDVPEIYRCFPESFLAGKVKLTVYEDASYPLSSLYRLTTARDRALARIVRMKSGANLYIDRTEALTAIDVNAAASSSSGPAVPEKKKLAVNLEAADEVARQLRLRNISGMILVDFISMKSDESKALLLEALRKAVKSDPVPVQVLDMTRLGLVEITRKKEGRDIYEAFSGKPVL
jgi:ribonuclease G